MCPINARTHTHTHRPRYVGNIRPHSLVNKNSNEEQRNDG